MAEMNKELEKDVKEELSAENNDDSSSNDSDNASDDSSDSSDSDSDLECTVCKKKFSGAVPLRQHIKGSKHKKVLSRKKKERKLINKDVDEEDEDVQEDIIPEPYQICKFCDKQFSGLEPYQMHLKSKVHKQKVLHASILKKVTEDGEINVDKLRDLYLKKKASPRKSDVPGDSKGEHASLDQTDDNNQDEHDKEEYECNDCNKTFCGLIPFGQHLASKTHSKQVERKSLLSKITSENVEERKKIPQNDVSSLTVEDDVLVCSICSTSFSGPESAMLHLKSRKHAKQLDKYLKKLEKKKKKNAKPKESDSDSTGSENNEAPEGKDELDASVLE